jgi:hypothetical protein
MIILLSDNLADPPYMGISYIARSGNFPMNRPYMGAGCKLAEHIEIPYICLAIRRELLRERIGISSSMGRRGPIFWPSYGADGLFLPNRMPPT